MTTYEHLLNDPETSGVTLALTMGTLLDADDEPSSVECRRQIAFCEGNLRNTVLNLDKSDQAGAIDKMCAVLARRIGDIPLQKTERLANEVAGLVALVSNGPSEPFRSIGHTRLCEAISKKRTESYNEQTSRTKQAAFA